MQCLWVYMHTDKLFFSPPMFSTCPTLIPNKVCDVTGLVNYCVPAGEAHPKALEIAQEINQKVKFMRLPIFLSWKFTWYIFF